MSDTVLDVSQPIKPIIIDPGTNEWLLKERKTPGLHFGNTDRLLTPDVVETEYLYHGKMYYRRVQHFVDNKGIRDEVEETAITASRLPGPTNGGLDLDERTRWMLTGNPFPLVQFTPGISLEARLRMILMRASLKVGPEVSKEFLAMITDKVTIALFVGGLAAYIAAHFATGPAAVALVVWDCISAAMIGFMLGTQAIPFFKALLRFLELVVDAQTEDEMDEAAQLLATMLGIVAVTAVQIAAAVLLKRIFSGLKTKAGAKAGRPVREPKPLDPFEQALDGAVLKKAPAGRVLRTYKGVDVIKNDKFLKAAKDKWIESRPNDIEGKEREQGFFLVEDAQGNLDVEPWPKNTRKRASLRPPPTVAIEGREGLFFNGKRVVGTMHTHPVRGYGPLEGGKFYDTFKNEVRPEPSEADGVVAQHFFDKGKFTGNHYILSHEGVYVFDHANGWELLGPLRKLIPGLPPPIY